MRLLILLITILLLSAGIVAGQTVANAPSGVASGPAVALELVAEGLTHPVMLQEAPDNTNRLFIVDQTGEIWIVGPDGEMLPEPFLDISDRLVELNPNYDERGLLGLAFHPDYVGNGRFFVYYSAPLRESAPDNYDHTNVLAELMVSAGDPNKADPASEQILLEMDWPYMNHNAGTIAFGPTDGYLYLSLGDGGNRDDVGIGHVDDWYAFNEGGNGQDIEQNLKGTILRIDVNAGDPYAIPEDNPFIGQTPFEEQWAYGFRNPYRFSFDMAGNHEMYVGDAGQELWEEVSLVTRGGNYGWNVKEGTHCFSTENPKNPPEVCPDIVGPGHPRAGDPLIDPIIEAPNSHQGGLGLVIIGGYVYRGTILPQLDGQYFFGMWSQGPLEPEGHLPGAVYVSQPSTEGMWEFQKVRIWNDPKRELPGFLLSFAQDLDGEMYVLTTHEEGPTGNTGKVWRMSNLELQLPFIVKAP